MKLLRKLFPFSFTQKDTITALVINLLIHLIILAAASTAIGILAGIPLIGFIFGIVGGLVDLYMAIGIILCLLDYFKVI